MTTWALPEWTVLSVVRQQPTHGFAIAALTAPGAELGRIWHIPRPVVYRALSRLEEAELVTPTAVESGPGPQRTIYAVTEQGRTQVDEWLSAPVEHVRHLRSHLLMKLALLDRHGIDRTELIRAQRAVLEPIVAAVAAERSNSKGFDQVLHAWRHATASAALSFLDDISGQS